MTVFTRPDAVKVAVTIVSPAGLDTVQIPVPEHAPLQPVKAKPTAGTALRVTVAPELSPSVQSKPQVMPAPVTMPMPVFATESVYAVLVPKSGIVAGVSGSLEGMVSTALLGPVTAPAENVT